MEIAATLGGKTPEEKLVSIYQWIRTNLVCKADAPYEWRNFDRLVQDRNYSGCADYSVVFGSLTRACGIPTVWVKSLDADWIYEYRTHGKEGHWNGHVFLEIYLHDRWMLLDDTQLVLYENYDPKMRIVPGNRYAYDKGDDPYDLVLSCRWELWKAQTRAFCRDFDLTQLPVGKGRALAGGAKGAASNATSETKKYPGVFVFFSETANPAARQLFSLLYPKLTSHMTGRRYSDKDAHGQLTEQTQPGNTIILLVLTDEKAAIPDEFQKLLPESWPNLKEEALRNGTARYNGEYKEMHLVVLVAKNTTELTRLVRETQW
jgi:hypothetical protein